MSIGSEPVGTKGDPRFFEANVSGLPLRAYVDLGSECVNVRQSEAEKLQLNLKNTDTILRGYGGAVVQPLGTCKVALKVDLVEAQVDAHVVPDSAQNVPVIVGQPFTDLPNVMLVQKGGNLCLFDSNQATLPEVDKLPPRRVKLWAEEATIIPPGEAANIKAKDRFLGIRNINGRSPTC